jgi:hypothetical protein
LEIVNFSDSSLIELEPQDFIFSVVGFLFVGKKCLNCFEELHNFCLFLIIIRKKLVYITEFQMLLTGVSISGLLSNQGASHMGLETSFQKLSKN